VVQPRSAGTTYRWVGLFALVIMVAGSLSLPPAAAATGDITTVAGIGASGLSGDGGPARVATLSFPFGVVSDAEGNIFIGDHNNSRIRRVDAGTGVITSVVGTTRGFSGDGGPATRAQIDGPVGLDLDEEGNLFIADFNNHRIRRVDADTQIITTVAGTSTSGYNGDGIPAVEASLNFPYDVDVDAEGNVLIADLSNSRIRRVDAVTGIITTVAGDGTAGFDGDGGPAVDAVINRPQGVTVDGFGNIFIADSENNLVRRIDAVTGIITTVETPDASLLGPSDTAVDADGNLFIADVGNHRILRVAAGTGTLSLVAGTGVSGDSGDGGPAVQANLRLPSDVFVTAAGDLLISDTYNHRIRRVEGVSAAVTTTTTTVAPTTTSTEAPTTTTTAAPTTTTTAAPTTTTTEAPTTTTTAAPTTTTAAPTTTTTTAAPTTTTAAPTTTTTAVPTTTSTTVPSGGEACASPTITGTAGDDVIMGTQGDDVIAALAGDDFVIGGGGNDTICGGDGDDSIDGRAGDDQAFGGSGADSLIGASGNDTLDGGADADDIAGDAGEDTLLGGTGRDKLRGGAAADTLEGGDDDDRLNGGDGSDDCDGGAGSNSLDKCESSPA
jgi:Ca2+-binding RTX toxin-like protein